MRNKKNISTDITALEKELEELREELTSRVTLIERKLSLLKEQLPTRKVVKNTANSFSKGDRVKITGRTHEGESGEITRVTTKSAWLRLDTEEKSVRSTPVIKILHNLRQE